MRAKKLTLYLLAGFLGGCIPVMSLHPLFTEKELAFDEKLLGAWADANETSWQFSVANEPEKIYELIFTDEKGKKGLFAAHLVKLENRLFLDVYPGEPPWDEKDPNKVEWLYNTFFFIPARTFIKVNGIEPQLKLRLTDNDEFKKLLKQDPNAVKYEMMDGNPVLTASTKEIQAFVLKYADDERLFSREKEIVLNRKESGAAKPSVKKNSNEPDGIKK